MKVGQAFVGGVLGGAAMTVAMAIARSRGLPVNVEMLLGTMTGMERSAASWTVGMVILLTVSGLVGIAYAAGFERVAHRGGVLPGLVLSIVHMVVSGLLLGAVSNAHPRIAELTAPGPFMSYLGTPGMLLFVALHLLFGAIVGTLYGSVAEPAPPRERSFGRPFGPAAPA